MYIGEIRILLFSSLLVPCRIFDFGEYLGGVHFTSWSFRQCSNRAKTCRTLHQSGIAWKLYQNVTTYIQKTSFSLFFWIIKQVCLALYGVMITMTKRSVTHLGLSTMLECKFAAFGTKKKHNRCNLRDEHVNATEKRSLIVRDDKNTVAFYICTAIVSCTIP